MTKSQLSLPHPRMDQNLKNQWKCNQHLIKMNFRENFFLEKHFFEKFLV